MVESKSNETRISGIGIILMVLGIAGLIFFGWQISETFNNAKPMEDAATSMSKLRSRAGDTVAEAYYNDHGDFLKGEAKIYSQMTLGIDVIGLLASLLVFAYGGSKKTLVEAITTRHPAPKSSKPITKKSPEPEDDEDL